MPDEQLRGIEQQAATSYKDEVLDQMESWFPDGGIVVIDPESPLAKERPEATQTVNRLFNDLGGTIFTAADVAAERMANSPNDSTEKQRYRRALEELRIVGEGINAFHKDLIVYPPQENLEYQRKRNQKETPKIGFHGEFIGDDGKEYSADIFIRKEPEDDKEARFRCDISNQDNEVVASIRIDPGDFGRIVYDLETPTLKSGEVDLTAAGQEVSRRTDKPTHHFPHPSVKLSRAEFGETLDVIDQHIRQSIERRGLKRAA